MPNILTPVSLWNSFDGSLDVFPEILSVVDEDDIRVEKLYFNGRDTGEGRVKVAAYFASSLSAPAEVCVLIVPDSTKTVDVELMKYFVRRGFSVLMVDYRGEWEGCDFYTQYPENIYYANTAKCGRFKNYVDESADKTTWYEWVGVCVYAKKYLEERLGNIPVAAVGIRDGGEIVWKLAVACKLSCIVPVSAAGWLAYTGLNKHISDELQLDEERYRFLAGIDSQAYAPHVKCPVLMLCTTNDAHFDYDRAFDTFLRINEEFVNGSSIAYSLHSNAAIDLNCTEDMFLFLNRYLKNRQIFLPKPATVSVVVDDKENLVARVLIDDNGVVEKCGVYLAEDCADSVMRDWIKCPPLGSSVSGEQDYLLNIYEKTSKIYVVCGVKYSNGFTVWSKINVKKISGTFRNMQHKSRVLYTAQTNDGGFMSGASSASTVGDIFHTENFAMPELVTKNNGTCGLYSPCGLITYRTANARFAPSAGSLLSIDVFTDENTEITLTFTNVSTGEEFIFAESVIGGVWQTIVAESGLFKSASGAVLADFTEQLRLSIDCPVKFAVNNIIWL